jgi:hypothetical protein
MDNLEERARNFQMVYANKRLATVCIVFTLSETDSTDLQNDFFSYGRYFSFCYRLHCKLSNSTRSVRPRQQFFIQRTTRQTTYCELSSIPGPQTRVTARRKPSLTRRALDNPSSWGEIGVCLLYQGWDSSSLSPIQDDEDDEQ